MVRRVSDLHAYSAYSAYSAYVVPCLSITPPGLKNILKIFTRRVKDFHTTKYEHIILFIL